MVLHEVEQRKQFYGNTIHRLLSVSVLNKIVKDVC